MFEFLLHKSLLTKVQYLYPAQCRVFMYVDIDNIQRDISQCHYRFNTNEDIVVLLGYKGVIKREDFVNLRNTNIKIKWNR